MPQPYSSFLESSQSRCSKLVLLTTPTLPRCHPCATLFLSIDRLTVMFHIGIYDLATFSRSHPSLYCALFLASICLSNFISVPYLVLQTYSQLEAQVRQPFPPIQLIGAKKALNLDMYPIPVYLYIGETLHPVLTPEKMLWLQLYRL